MFERLSAYHKDMPVLRRAVYRKQLPQLDVSCMSFHTLSNLGTYQSAGLAATYEQLVMFSRALPRYKFSEILVSPRFNTGEVILTYIIGRL